MRAHVAKRGHNGWQWSEADATMAMVAGATVCARAKFPPTKPAAVAKPVAIAAQAASGRAVSAAGNGMQQSVGAAANTSESSAATGGQPAAGAAEQSAGAAASVGKPSAATGGDEEEHEKKHKRCWGWIKRERKWQATSAASAFGSAATASASCAAGLVASGAKASASMASGSMSLT